MTHSHVTWLIHTWHDSFKYDNGAFISDAFSISARHFMRVVRVAAIGRRRRRPWLLWRIHMWHDSFTRDMTHSCVTATHSYVTHSASRRGTPCEWCGWQQLVAGRNKPWLLWLVHIWHDSFTCDIFSDKVHDGCTAMGWLRWVGSLKLQVSFAKEPYKRDCILQKRTVILRSLLFSSSAIKCTMVALVWGGYD